MSVADWGWFQGMKHRPWTRSAVLCANAASGHLKHQPSRFKGFQLGTLPSEMDQPDIVSSSLKMQLAALNS
jgi:hypothetical protein